MVDEPQDTSQTVEDGWQLGWDEHEQAQLRRMAQMSLYDKIGWLEEAHRMVLHLQGNRTTEETRDEAKQNGDERVPLEKGA